MREQKVKQQTDCKAVPVAPREVAWCFIGELVAGRGATLQIKPLYAIREEHPMFMGRTLELAVYRCRRKGSKLVTTWLLYANAADLPCSEYTSEMRGEDMKLYDVEFPSERADD